MSQDVFRSLYLLDESVVDNVKIDTGSANIDEGDIPALANYASMMALLFSTVCDKFIGKEDEAELIFGDVSLERYQVERFPEYIKLFVIINSAENGGKVLFGYNPKQNKLSIEFNDSQDNPAVYDATLARAMLGTLSRQ